MAEETDGVGETFDDSLRIALTIASQFGERAARLREQLARQREAGAVQEARELSTRFEAERGAARASLAPVQQCEWWNKASAQEIADVHETATAWCDFDFVAADAGDTIRCEVRERYGIDVDAPGADTAAVAAALVQAERDRADAAAERAKSGRELTASQLLLTQADRHERDAHDTAETNLSGSGSGSGSGLDEAGGILDNPADADRLSDTERQTASQRYDSSERRQQFANNLEGKGIAQETIAARMLADGENAKHPREAVGAGTGQATRVRSKIKSAVQQRDRGGLSR